MANRSSARLVTENKLVHGMPATAPRVRIRLATAADIDALGAATAMAQVPFEQMLREAIEDGSACAGLRAGVRGGHEAYMRYMAERFTAHQYTNLMSAYVEAALVLVAEHRDQGVLGGLMAYPPLNVAEQVIDALRAAGASQRERFKMLMAVGMFLTRIKALAVAEHARGAHIGSSLLKWCRLVYFQCHYQTIYGVMPSTPGLDQFYRRAGFTVQDDNEPLDLSLMFGFSTQISPANGERIFRRDRPWDS